MELGVVLHPSVQPLAECVLLCPQRQDAVFFNCNLELLLYLDARTRWNGESNKLQSLHFEIFTPHNPLLLEYVSQYYHIDDSQEIGGQAKAPVGTPEEIVNDMYEIIYRSVFENEPLQYIGKSEKGK